MAFAAAVNVEKKLQKLHTKTSQKDMAKLQICQLNLANYGSVRTLTNPISGYIVQYQVLNLVLLKFRYYRYPDALVNLNLASPSVESNHTKSTKFSIFIGTKVTQLR